MLLQIIDVSDRMLYNEVKTQKLLLTLINATVSHELRNPLNSMIGNIIAMEEHYKEFD